MSETEVALTGMAGVLAILAGDLIIWRAPMMPVAKLELVQGWVMRLVGLGFVVIAGAELWA